MNQKHDNKRVLIGPVTKALLIGIATFGIYSYFTRPSDRPERRYFEADASGRLVRVERPSVTQSAAPTLWKPEPKFLLALQHEIALQPDQARRIRQIEDAWAAAKVRLERQMDAVTQPVGKERTVEAIRAGLSDYSSLSRKFGREREQAWSSAVAILTEQQRESVFRFAQDRVVRK